MACPVFCMKDAKIFSSSVDFLSVGGPWKEGCGAWLGKLADNYESWIDYWKNYDNHWENQVGNGLTLSGYGCFGSMRNSCDFSSQDCMFEREDCYWALKRPHSSAQDTFVEREKLGTPKIHSSLLDSKYIPELKISLG